MHCTLQVMRFFPFLLLLASSAIAATDAYIPIAGRATGAGGRRFDTTVWITNVSDEHAVVTLSFLRAAQANPTPFTYTQRLAPAEVRRIALPDYLIGTAGVGALRVYSPREVLATAHLFSIGAGENEAHAVGASIDAVSAANAIGTNETTLVTGVATPGVRYKLYAVETTSHPLYFTITSINERGEKLTQKRYFIGAREARSFDVPATGVALRIHGVNGSGKIIVCGVAVANESQDSTVFSMSVPSSPRHRLPLSELAAYLLIAILLGVRWQGHRFRIFDAKAAAPPPHS